MYIMTLLMYYVSIDFCNTIIILKTAKMLTMFQNSISSYSCTMYIEFLSVILPFMITVLLCLKFSFVYVMFCSKYSEPEIH